MVFVSNEVEKATWRKTIGRYGYNPFRLGTGTVRAYIFHYGTILNKYSALYDLFNPYIMRMRQADIIDHFTRSHLWFWQPDPPDDEVHPVGLSHLLMGWGMFGGGVILCIATFVLERKGIITV